MKNPKTEKGLLSAAQHLVNGLSTKNKVLQLKLSHGKFYEPIALSKYEQYMKSINHDIQVEKSGFVIDYKNFVLGASPDSKVVDLLEDPVYGLVEIKCPEEYKDFNPRDICYISKNPCIQVDEYQNVKLRKDHYYYDQVQYQLGVSCQSWCDFVLYTNKGLIVDRIKFDRNHWNQLKEELLQFYFKYYLLCLIKSEEK